MQRTLTHVMAGTLLSACVGITYAGDAPRILGAIEYQALSQPAMAQVVGKHGGSLAGGGVDSWRTNPSVSEGKPAGGTGDVTLQAGSGNINSGGEF